MENQKLEITYKYCDSQFIKDVRKNLNEQRKSGKRCDFILETKDGGNLKVHKSILEAASPYFKAMFNAEFEDSHANSVQLDQVSSFVLEKIVEFMYIGETEISVDIVKETLDTALFLGLMDLVKKCTVILVETVNNENCFELLAYSEKYSYENISNKCFEVILQNIEAMTELPEFTGMPPEAMKMLVSYDQMENINQEQLCLAVIKWIEFDKETRKTYTKTLLDKINFEEISEEFSVTKIFKNNSLLDLEEYRDKLPDIVSGLLAGEKRRGIIPSMYLMVNNEIRQYDPRQKTFPNVITRLRKKKRFFASTTFGRGNYFICGGQSLGTRRILNTCEFYNMDDGTWSHSLPPMMEYRFYHRSVTLDNKIFVCGGICKSSVEYLDICRTAWYGAAPLRKEMPQFGLCTLGNCIYAVNEENFECYDLRTGEWTMLPLRVQSPAKIFSAISYENYIYGFDPQGICIFDIRNNCWINQLQIYAEETTHVWAKLCMCNDNIYFISENKESMRNNANIFLQTWNIRDLSIQDTVQIYENIPVPYNCYLFSLP